MSSARDTVTVRVPASTSNCGAGFDTLGMALALYNRVTVTLTPGRLAEPRRPADARAQAMVGEAAELFFKTARLRPVGFRYRIDGDVPPARGLGSSVTVLAGVLAGLDALLGAGWSKHQLVAAATELEGHPDNASAGILGGFCVSRCDPVTNAYVDTVRIAVPETLSFVIASPQAELLTKESRGVLPAMLPYFDAVKSINSAAYLTAAFATGEFEKLRHAAGDFMHEPYRLPKIPGASVAIAAAKSAGAYVAWLSGSGSSVLAVSPAERAENILAAMKAALANAGVAGEARILRADNEGLRLD